MMLMYDKQGNFVGHFWPEEHRTVGDYRAWSFPSSQWCYPNDPCAQCADHMRDLRPCPACDGQGWLPEEVPNG